MVERMQFRGITSLEFIPIYVASNLLRNVVAFAVGVRCSLPQQYLQSKASLLVSLS